MSEKPSVPELLARLFEGQNLAVLATLGGGRPYGNLVAFAATDDFKNIIFATTRATRKFRNILQEPRVSMLIDNRSNETADFREAIAATVLGSASVVEEGEKEKLLPLFLRKHPYLQDFVNAPTCAVLKIRAEKYIVVYRFQNVVEMDVAP